MSASPTQEEPEQEEDAELLTVHLDPLQAGGARQLFPPIYVLAPEVL